MANSSKNKTTEALIAGIQDLITLEQISKAALGKAEWHAITLLGYWAVLKL